MNKIKILFLFIIGATLTFASCNKDDDDDGGGDTTPKTCYVVKSTSDDGSYTQITYNAENKVIKTEEFDASGNSDDNYSIYTYSSGKLTKMEATVGGSIETKMELTYNTEDLPINVDLYQDQGAGLLKLGFFEYTYSGTKIKNMSMNFEVLGQMMVVSKSEFTYSGDNISLVKKYELGGTLSLELVSTTAYDYDDKKNPMKNIGLDYFMGEVQFISINNYTEMTVKDASSSIMQEESYNITYEYNSDNYPTKITNVSFDNSTTEVEVYTYDCK